ncbi:hypothetical protein Tsubulata_011825 [Turnera subulata]|uniref:GH3 middle domain-containing protein n=1 Tax=Turnera subulata TaxID=218843 RepID=A0A9Q0FCT2_9ROSI|nr:hypothetical protein Tsubulata_011825 [Turnera subulata]
MTVEEVLQSFEESTKKAIDHQLHTLQSILAHQASVSYLHPYLSGHLPPIDAATFRRLVPLSSYDDYADHIDTLANYSSNGDHPPVLSVDPLHCFHYSSGTSTMKPKLIPCFDSALATDALKTTLQGLAAFHQKLFPPRPRVNKILWFLYDVDNATTPSGFQITSASFHFLLKENSLLHRLSSPREVIFGQNIEHQMYCHLLCALGDSDVIDGVRSFYARLLVRAFGMLESKWEQLCNDLENGFPSLEISDAAMRESVCKVLGGPRVDLSRRIRMICKENNWAGIVSKLWPNIRYVKCVSTGSMKQYYSKLKYYAGEVMVLGGDYGASECIVAINLDATQPPETTRYVMLPTEAYFEFLPFDSDRSSAAAAGGQETVDFSGVEEGKMYELVVTTYKGLYRYRLGDIVRVVGFHNSSPLIEFVMRSPKGAYEVMETDLISAMESFQLELRNHMGMEIVEYTTFLESDTCPKQLKFFVEIENFMFLQQEKLQESVEALQRRQLQ